MGAATGISATHVGTRQPLADEDRPYVYTSNGKRAAHTPIPAVCTCDGERDTDALLARLDESAQPPPRCDGTDPLLKAVAMNLGCVIARKAHVCAIGARDRVAIDGVGQGARGEG